MISSCLSCLPWFRSSPIESQKSPLLSKINVPKYAIIATFPENDDPTTLNFQALFDGASHYTGYNIEEIKPNTYIIHCDTNNQPVKNAQLLESFSNYALFNNPIGKKIPIQIYYVNDTINIQQINFTIRWMHFFWA